jgi:hypothetical protein
VERIVELSTEPGDLVVDPFAGTGVVAAVAHEMGRRGLAIDVSEKFRRHFEQDVKLAVDEWWSRREFERAEVQRQRGAFFRANVGLRVVKTGRVVVERLADSGISVAGCWLNVGRPRREMPWASVVMTILLTRGELDAVRREAEELLSRAPLSKFGLDVKVRALHLSRFRAKGRAVLSYDTYLNNREVSADEFRDKCQSSPSPLIASSLPVELDDIRAINTKYWRNRHPPSYLREESFEYSSTSGQIRLLED